MKCARRCSGLVPGLFVLAMIVAAVPATAKELVEIPINVGLGPAAYMITGAIQDDQAIHYGLHLDLAAVIDKATIKKHQKKIPKKYRKMVASIGEARIGHLLIPDSLFISPKTKNTQIYGATWRPLAVNQPLLDAGIKLTVGAGLVLTYTYIDMASGDDSDTEETSTTHFLRPGLDLRANIDVPFSDAFILSVGWSSGFYIPQEIGSEMFAMGEGKESIWHVGQGYVVFNYRFGYKTKI